MGQNLSANYAEIDLAPARFIAGGVKKFYQKEPVIYLGNTIKSINPESASSDPEKLDLQCYTECNMNANCKGISFVPVTVNYNYSDGQVSGSFEGIGCELKSQLGESQPVDEQFSPKRSYRKLDIQENPYSFSDLNIGSYMSTKDRSVLVGESLELFNAIESQNANLAPAQKRPWLITPPASVVAQQQAAQQSAVGRPLEDLRVATTQTSTSVPRALVIATPPLTQTPSTNMSGVNTSNQVQTTLSGSNEPKQMSVYTIAIALVVAVITFVAIAYGVKSANIQSEIANNLYAQVAVAVLIGFVVVYFVRV